MTELPLSGLSNTNASERLKTFGYNELPTSGRKSVLGILLRVLREPMLLLLLTCGLVYVLKGEARDGMLLFISALFVVGLTLFQEVRSERSLEALRDLSSPHALVTREGVVRRIPGREIVPGDLVHLTEGDRIPADAVLISGSHLAVDESLLTGESFSVAKGPSPHFREGSPQQDLTVSQLSSGTLVVSGQGLAIVTQTGPLTALGRIGKSLEFVSESTTPLQKEINRMVRVFGVLGVTFSLSIAAIYGLTRGDWPKGILAGLAAAMSLLPEELPVVMTVFFAMGAWRIARKQVLTRRVAAIEALGSISVLCVDKTGTLTQNRMALKAIRDGSSTFDLSVSQKLPPEALELLRLSALACHETPYDPMEKAIIESAQNSGAFINDSSALSRLKLYPLSSGFMAMACVWKKGNTLLIAAKGAPEAILDLCHTPQEKAKEVLIQVKAFASQGLRVLAVAHASESASSELPAQVHSFSFHFVGLLGLEDPIRPEVPAAITECQTAGIRVLMLTGDYPETARSIAKKLNMPLEVVAGSELMLMDDLQLQQRVGQTSVFARVTPDQKLRIVAALKKNGERVAMTGDGVNDAPSLKLADIGVAMGQRGTDVAREAASIVLLNDSFASLVTAIRLGRRIYDNLQKALFFILAIHVPIAGLTILPVIFKLPLFLLPVHIVFLELIIDPACSLIYEAESEEADIMNRMPRAANAKILNFRDMLSTLTQGFGILVLVFAVFLGLLQSSHPVTYARTGAFFTLILSSLALILVNRSRNTGTLSVLKSTLQTQNRAFIGISSASLTLLACVYLIPQLRSLFGFSLLDFPDLSLALVAGCSSVLLAGLIRGGFKVKSL